MDTKLQASPPDPFYPDAKHADSWQRGVEFQDFVCARLARDNIILQNLQSRHWQYRIGENLQGFEIKLDSRCTETGQLSIEVAEKSRAANALWIPSGIMRDDNSWLYIQGNYEVLFVFAKKTLRAWHKQKQPELHESFGTVQKFYLALKDADRCAARTLRFTADGNVVPLEARHA